MPKVILIGILFLSGVTFGQSTFTFVNRGNHSFQATIDGKEYPFSQKISATLQQGKHTVQILFDGDKKAGIIDTLSNYDELGETSFMTYEVGKKGKVYLLKRLITEFENGIVIIDSSVKANFWASDSGKGNIQSCEKLGYGTIKIENRNFSNYYIKANGTVLLKLEGEKAVTINLKEGTYKLVAEDCKYQLPYDSTNIVIDKCKNYPPFVIDGMASNNTHFSHARISSSSTMLYSRRGGGRGFISSRFSSCGSNGNGRSSKGKCGK
jgi:hypothetical protein